MKYLLYSLLSLAILSVSALVGLHLYTDFTLYPKILAAQTKFQSYEKFILADLKTLEKFPVFIKNEYKSDASQMLASALTGESSSNKIIDRLFAANPNWVTDKIHFKELTADPQFAELEPKWIEKLKPFDHWKAEKSSVLEVERMKGWAAVYAIKKLQTKDLHAGLKIYRKVAELINSMGHLNSQTQSIWMLKAEHKLMNDFQARDWQLIPMGSLEAYRRLTWAWIHIGRQPFYEPLKSVYLSHAYPPFGVCASVLENASSLFTAREYLEPKSFFEQSFAQNYARAEEFHHTMLQRCHLPAGLQLTDLAPKAESSSTSLRNFTWNRLAFIRRFVGLNLFLSSSPDALSIYGDYASEKKKN